MDADMITLADIKPRVPEVRRVDDAIVFQDRYEIALDRCDTPEKALGWVVHMSEKTWVTPLMLRDFVKAAANAHGFEIYTLN